MVRRTLLVLLVGALVVGSLLFGRSLGKTPPRQSQNPAGAPAGAVTQSSPAGAQPSAAGTQPSPLVTQPSPPVTQPSPSPDNPGQTPGPTASVGPAPSASPAPSGPVGPFPVTHIEFGGTLTVTPGAIAAVRSGQFASVPGQAVMRHAQLPAPWTGGSARSVDLYVRLPAGYDPVHKRYPTVYLTPNPYLAWSHVFGPGTRLAALEATGAVPPMIYVFAPTTGAPIDVTNCIDSKDGRVRWDSFMSGALVSWVDSHFATIADPAARTIMGSSQGGYCAAVLLLRHPDVWHLEVSFAGFYDAASRLARTARTGGVYGGDQALMDAYSPITIAPRLGADVRKQLFFVLLGQSSQGFYGPQMDQFAGILDQNSYARAVIESPWGHSWGTVSDFLPRAIRLIAGRLVTEGVLH